MSAKMSRRKFLAAVGAGGAAVTAMVASKVGGESKPGVAQAATEGKGYQLTAHVRRYYETTKV